MRLQKGERSESGEGTRSKTIFHNWGTLCSDQSGGKICLLVSEVKLGCRQEMTCILCVLPLHRQCSPLAQKEVKKACFHWGKTTQVMDDNSSIVALGHILDRYIMRQCYCFLHLLWSCPNTTFVSWEYLARNQWSRINRMFNSSGILYKIYRKLKSMLWMVVSFWVMCTKFKSIKEKIGENTHFI